MAWHDIRDPGDPELDRLAAQYQLHPLHIEDCRHRNQNAKIEEGPGYLFVVLKPVLLNQDQSLDVFDLDLFIGKDFVITVEEGDCPSAREILNQVHGQEARLRPDQAFYRVMDGIVDTYAPVLDGLNDEIDRLEDEVLESPQPRTLQKVLSTKRCLITMRRVMANTRDVTAHLQRSGTELVDPQLWPFFRDVYDHIARNLDTIDMQRDLLTGSMDIYLSSVANRTNQVMKVLTVLGTAALPALVISGFYGMNLHHLPWADSPYALAVVAALMVLTTSGLLYALRKLHWF